jgi:hypothetical protein
MLDWALGKFWLLFGISSIALIVGGLKSLGPTKKAGPQCEYWTGIGEVGLDDYEGRTGLSTSEVTYLLVTQKRDRLFELLMQWGSCEYPRRSEVQGDGGRD